MASYSNLDLIDFGVYITTTKAMQKFLPRQYGHNWDGSLYFEKVEKYLPYFKAQSKFLFMSLELTFDSRIGFQVLYKYTRTTP